MKALGIWILMTSICFECCSQQKYKDFIQTFQNINLPIEDVMSIQNKDTLNGKFTNDIIMRNQNKKAQITDKDGNIKTVTQYYGLYPEEPDGYLKDVKSKNGKIEEARFFFYPKIIPIGVVKLNDKYDTPIIKVIGFETTFYDLWSFSKEGKALSVVCLFWGMRDGGPNDENVTFTIVDSNITKDGYIIWHENADGLETFRTYKLNGDGLFQIMKEEQKGEAEF